MFHLCIFVVSIASGMNPNLSSCSDVNQAAAEEAKAQCRATKDCILEKDVKNFDEKFTRTTVRYVRP